MKIESEPKAIELTNMNAESEEGKEERDFSSDDSIADPNYALKIMIYRQVRKKVE